MATENSTAIKNSAFTDCSFIDCPTAAVATAIPSSYFVPAILDQLFRSTVTEYSATEDSSIKRFTTSSAIKSFVFIKYSTIKSFIAECSSTNYSILFYLLYFTALAVCVYYHYYYCYSYCHYYYYYCRCCYYF